MRHWKSIACDFCLGYFVSVMKRYDVIIAGAGPSGIFTAWQLISSMDKIRIFMKDKGGSLAERVEKTRGRDYEGLDPFIRFRCLQQYTKLLT